MSVAEKTSIARRPLLAALTPKEIRLKDSARRRPPRTQRPIDADGLSRRLSCNANI